ncbi:radical SAM superfamily protein [Hirsutella rhossiliensis]|uniref:Radical SAM superfamily domain-containing protein n=1 Tax=Hirsutella rhossiliensis TaxID=111463 RepID=A0A9P8SFJ2_9HYPO|nr:radical SAM superfamily domain-containing protein [Hirsutella rhossiliensis]KAH0960993.1 radical SAM superfamily domain-containing protein [Hirsutella rhossiliensis]
MKLSGSQLVRALPRPGRPPWPQARRSLHLVPPFLLDDYMPRYQTLSSRGAAEKRSTAYAHLRNCNLCPRRCGVNRYETTGHCLIGDEVKVNVIAPHFGEGHGPRLTKFLSGPLVPSSPEPCIQGHNGSGAVFMSGCNLRCVFCQNFDIAHQRKGFDLTPEQLGEWYIKLQDVGHVHNINIVTPEHVVPQVALSILHARDLGLRLPIVYNTSSFDSLESLRLMDGLVDIYLADFKVWEPSTSKRLLKADDYAATARESVCAMQAQVGDLCFTADGIAKRGVLVRHLVMPGREAEGAEIMRFLATEVSTDCFVNIMEQYHPDGHVGKKKRAHQPGSGQDDKFRYADINRAATGGETSSIRKAATDAGLWRFNEAPRHGGFAL